MQLVIESAGVTDGLPRAVPPPQRRRGRVAVGALGALSPLGVLKEQTTTLCCTLPCPRIELSKYAARAISESRVGGNGELDRVSD